MLVLSQQGEGCSGCSYIMINNRDRADEQSLTHAGLVQNVEPSAVTGLLTLHLLCVCYFTCKLLVLIQASPQCIAEYVTHRWDLQGTLLHPYNPVCVCLLAYTPYIRYVYTICAHHNHHH